MKLKENCCNIEHNFNNLSDEYDLYVINSDCIIRNISNCLKDEVCMYCVVCACILCDVNDYDYDAMIHFNRSFKGIYTK